MIDPMLSLAFTVHSNKGVYALLLGSGVSRGAGIPTGWEVVLDLVKKLASLKGANAEEDLVEWYTKEFGEEPSYDRLLNDLAKSPTARANLLKSYFEPTTENSDEELRKPTQAHKAIAQLVKGGYIRVILTTNFDRLIENALHEVDITPTVISTADATVGALPLTHAPVTVIKLHGDYLDTRIKNTPKELEVYDDRMNALLDRILDEYGLIACGWSAEYDPALRAALERCKSHRFTTYWTQKDEPGVQANKLISLRRAEIVKINAADEFFLDLSEKVQSLEELSRPHPISIQAAVASVKRYLVDERHRIVLRDLISLETERLVDHLSDSSRFPLNMPRGTNDLVNRTKQYQAVSETLLSLMITGCYWGKPEQSYLWRDCLQRITNCSESDNGINSRTNFLLYPDLLLVYAGGIASIASNRFYNLFAILEGPVLQGRFSDKRIYQKVQMIEVFKNDLAKQLPGLEKQYTPGSDHLWKSLRKPLHEYLPGNMEYDEAFDRFELFFALTYVNRALDDPMAPEDMMWGPVGCFGWRCRDRYGQNSLLKTIKDEVNKQGQGWEPLRAGFFDGSLERVKTVCDRFENFLIKLTRMCD